jgi:hypothetical protein
VSLQKVGLHILSGYSGNLGKPRVVKLVNASVAYKQQVRDHVGPACLIVIRWWLNDQPLNNPVQNARDWYAAHRAEMLAIAAGDPNVIFEAAYNEIPREQRAAYAVFLLELMRLMHADGLRCAVGSWSVGTPELEDWDNEYRPVVEAMQPGDVLSLHEYMADGADVQNRWHIGRFLLSPRIKDKPIIITEYGRDVFTENGRTFGFPGWHADPNCSPNQYLGELRAGGAVYDACPNVLGVCVFTAGQITDKKWQDFEVNSIAAIIVAEGGGEYSAGELPPATPPQVVTPPAEPPQVVMAIVNTGKAWYSADGLFGPYDGHPRRARDMNLETGGNTDLGEPLQAPFEGDVVYASNAGGKHGKVIIIVGIVDGELTCWHGKHLQRIDTRIWAHVKPRTPIGAIGNAEGQYAGAHLHEEICIGAITGPTQDWRDPAFEYVDPAEWYKAHGVDPALVDRMCARDGR